MEAGNPLLDDYVLGLAGRERPEGLLPAVGERRRRPLHRALLPRTSRPSAASRRTSRCSAASAGSARPARAPARPGPDLRRRRQRHQPARRVAGPRRRRGAARGLGARRRAVRAERRLAVLVRRGGHRLPRRARAGRRPGPAPVLQHRPLRRASRRAAAPTTGRSPTGCAPATRPRTAPRCTSSAPSSRASSPPAASPRVPRRACVGGQVIETALAADYLGAAPAAPALADAACGRRADASSPWAAAGFTSGPTTRARRLRPRPRRRPPRAAHLPAAHRRRRRRGPDRAASTPRSTTARASRPISPCSGSARSRSRCASTCSSRTSSTSAAAACSTCSPSGARTTSTR